MVRTPQKLEGAGRKRRLEYCVNRLKNRTGFKPDKKYNLLVRKDHEVPEEWSEFDTANSTGLLRRNQHWEKVQPIQKVRLSRARNTPSGKTAIEDIQSKKDFTDWFERTFEGLEDGVYGAVQQNGKAQGYHTLFLLRFEGGKVIEWKRKSDNQEDRKDGSASSYYAIPFLIHLVNNYVGQD